MRRLLAVLAMASLGNAWALEAGHPIPALVGDGINPRGEIALASFKGRVLYVDFWASWCVPCRQSMPALDTLYKKHAAEGFAVVGINKDVSAAAALRFLDKVPVTFALVQDPGDRFARGFEVAAMPTGYLADRRGIVRYVHRGFNDRSEADLTREIEQLLKEKP
jgi:thiol-disulfide isomerase/thioredoxin